MTELRAITRLIVTQSELEDVGFKGILEGQDQWNLYGAGTLVLAKDTQRVLLCRRSDQVPNAGLWSTWGGFLKVFEFPKQGMLRKLNEQSGMYTGSPYQGGHTNDAPGVYPLMTFHDMQDSFLYYNFLTVIDAEFEPQLNYEMSEYGWFNVGSWPSPKDTNLERLLSNSLTEQTIRFRS